MYGVHVNQLPEIVRVHCSKIRGCVVLCEAVDIVKDFSLQRELFEGLVEWPHTLLDGFAHAHEDRACARKFLTDSDF